MYMCSVEIRVRYSETDRMGFVYYGNYAQYFEVARVEALKKLGVSYKELEDSGIMLPVLDFQIKYYKPAYYDDLLTIETTITEIPGTRIRFGYKTYNEKEELLNEAVTTLVFVSSESKRPCRAPQEIIHQLENYF